MNSEAICRNCGNTGVGIDGDHCTCKLPSWAGERIRGQAQRIGTLEAEVKRLRRIEVAGRVILYEIPKDSWRILTNDAARAFLELQESLRVS